MRVHVKELQYWKTEHKDLNGCQDAYSLDTTRGLFAVADGAGTTLFPAIWARILARHFVDIPLMSADPFEVEWWVRLAQDEYKRKAPDIEKLLDWSVRQKAQSQGSDSTLATMRISAVDDTPTQAQAELLVFGDSCVIIGDTQTQRIESFVLRAPADFDQAPICISSALRFFNRNFHRCSITSKTLQPRHVVILATDAVSKWILSGGSDGSQWNTFQEVCHQSVESWPAFIDGCRKRKEMVDDDATALVLILQEDGANGDGHLGSETTHGHPVVHDGTAIDVIKERKEAFAKAQQDKNNELVAIYYGDGKDLTSVGITMAEKEIRHAQEVADALKEVLRAYRQAQNTPGVAAKVEPVWRQYGHLLQNERCADGIRKTLQDNGVNLALPTPFVPPAPPPSPAEARVPISTGQSAQSGEPVAIQKQPSAAVAADGGLAAQLEKQNLRIRFLEAYQNDEDDAILRTFEAIEAARSHYPDLPPFSEREARRIAQAQTRRQALQKLQQALSNGSVEQIEQAYDPKLIDEKSLTPDQLKRVELAQQLMKAYRDADDEEVVATHQQILADYPTFFTFTPQQQQQVSAARQRRNALAQFRVALESWNLSQIVRTYDPVLDHDKALTKDQRQILVLARTFVEAFHANDDAAIVAANEKIKNSPYRQQIALTQRERDRIVLAEAGMNTQEMARKLVVASVKGTEFSLEQVRKACTVKEPYINYRISLLQQQAPSPVEDEAMQELDLRIAHLKMEIDPQQLAHFALEDLIEDVLIRERIDEEKQKGASLDDFDVNSQFLAFFDAFEKQAVADYDTFLTSNRLDEDDVQKILLLLLRRELFPVHFQNQQMLVRPRWFGRKPMQWDEWLEEQKMKAPVTYMQYSTDPHRRGLWLYELLQPGK